MKVKRLKEILESMDDEFDVFVRNSINPLGNISKLSQVESSTYGFFGESIPCLIINTDVSKGLEMDKDDEYIDFVEYK